LPACGFGGGSFESRASEPYESGGRLDTGVLAWRRRCCRASLVEAAGAQAWEPDESRGHLDAGCAGMAEAAERCAVRDGVMVDEVAEASPHQR
jgi:hypothetical protein